MMILKDKFRKWQQDRQAKRFWSNPDSYLAAIILNDSNDQVYGMVKDGLAKLERIPEPNTGYSYLDVVKINGPTGKQLFRDEKICEYKAISVYQHSNIATYSFKAVLPDSNDYFHLLDWFRNYGKKAEFSWSPNDNNMEWRNGLCTADNFKQAQAILSNFIDLDSRRKFKDLKLEMPNC